MFYVLCSGAPYFSTMIENLRTCSVPGTGNGEYQENNSSTFLETHGVKMIRHANRTCGMQGRYGTGVTIMRYGII